MGWLAYAHSFHHLTDHRKAGNQPTDIPVLAIVIFTPMVEIGFPLTFAMARWQMHHSKGNILWNLSSSHSPIVDNMNQLEKKKQKNIELEQKASFPTEIYTLFLFTKTLALLTYLVQRNTKSTLTCSQLIVLKHEGNHMPPSLCSVIQQSRIHVA